MAWPASMRGVGAVVGVGIGRDVQKVGKARSSRARCNCTMGCQVDVLCGLAAQCGHAHTRTPAPACPGRCGRMAQLPACGHGPEPVAFGLRTCLRSPRGRAAALSGWAARRGAQWIAQLSTSAATPQTARQGHCPKGLSEIGRLNAPAACMGMSPCGASEASTHPDCAPTRSPARSSTRSKNLNRQACAFLQHS